MIILRQTNPSLPTVTVVCCVHGDERFGLTVFDRLKNDPIRREHLELVLANEEALEANRRYLETDLNRSFPGRVDGSLEERLAHQLLPTIKRARFVLDIHTTTSDIQMTPIVTSLGPSVQKILRHTTSREIAFIQRDPPTSLISQIQCGVSLEFNQDYATTEAAFDDVLRVVDGIRLSQDGAPLLRQVFYVTDVIPRTVPIPQDAKNFQFIPEQNGYPFLLNERAYPHLHALKATRVEEMVL